MLLSADLASILNASAPSTKQSAEGMAATGASSSWLSLVDNTSAEGSGKQLINQLFMAYSNESKDDPLARFAEDLRALLSAHGVELESDMTLIPAANTGSSWQPEAALTEVAWSIDELLQMSLSMAQSGNQLPLADESLPSILSDWLASLTTDGPAVPTPGLQDQPAPSAAEIAAVTAAAAGARALASADSASLSDATLPGQTVELVSEKAGPSLPADGTDTAQSTTQSGSGSGAVRADANGVLTHAALAAVPDQTKTSTAETAVDKLVDKSAPELASSSAFRSVRFSQHAEVSDGPNSGVDNQGPIRSTSAAGSGLWSAVSQGMAASQGSSVADLTTNPASGLTSSAAQAQDGGFVVSRAEQRMFATEHAQQVQAQQQQQTATRTADGLPRFAMDTPFGQQGWSDSIGRQLLVMSSQGVSSAQIRLDPPELGSLTVKIQVSADQQTSVSFVSQHAVVRDALEQQLNRLQDLFREQGLNLQDVSVSDQSARQGQGEDGGSSERRGGNTAVAADDTDAEMESTVSMRPEALIDYYA